MKGFTLLINIINSFIIVAAFYSGIHMSARYFLESNKNKDLFYPHRYYRINGTYISFEFEGVNKLKKNRIWKILLNRKQT